MREAVAVVRRWMSIAVAVGALTGCALAAAVRSYDVAPNGLGRADDELRRALARGDGDAAAQAKAKDLPDDRLLRSLYEATLSYYAGRFDQSASALQAAEDLAEDRYTKSVKQGIMSLIMNDRALDYVPGDNERLLARYYGAMAYLRRGDLEGAAVEARRLSYMLAQLDEKRETRDVQTRAFLRYFAGSVFEAAGESNDATVAYRNAAQLLGDSAAARAGGANHEGNVVVLVEQGFISHRVNRSIYLTLGGTDNQLFVTEDGSRRRRGSYGVARRLEDQLDAAEDDGLYLGDAVATPRFALAPGVDSLAPDSLRDTTIAFTEPLSPPSKPVATPASKPAITSLPKDVTPSDATKTPTITINPKGSRKPETDGWLLSNIVKGPTKAHEDARREAHVDDDEYVLKVSLPTFRRARRFEAPSVRADSVHSSSLVSASLSDAAAADYRRQRSAIIARAVARAFTKYALTKAAEKKAEDKWGDAAGSVGKFVANAAANALERADTRSWHLLPERVSVVRLSLKPGKHQVSIDAGGQMVSLGEVVVPDAGLVFATKRVWR